MDQENQPSVDINSADAETLTQLQGVGGRLAERIIEGRPFESIDDLTRVRGISEKDVERLRPFLNISDISEQPEAVEDETIEEPDEAKEVDESEEVEAELDEEPEAEGEESIEDTGDFDMPDGADEEAEFVDEEIATDEDEIVDEVPEELEPVEKPVAQPAYVTRGGACGLIFLGAFFTLIFSIIITLGILSSFNNGRLSYASPYQIAALQSQTESLSTQAQTLTEDIDGLRTRMDNLESLSGQMSEMQTEFNALQEEIVDLQTIVTSNQEEYDLLVAQIEVLNEDIDDLSTQSERFEGFLEGLRSLMDSLFPESLEVEETP